MFKFFKRLLLLLLFVGIIIGGLTTYKGFQLYQDAISLEPIDRKFDHLHESEHYVHFDELPPLYIDAVLAVEDKKFFEHRGINIETIWRALWIDIISLAPVEGGSTITQQIAKNEYFTQDKEITRKVAEVFMSQEIEKHFSKEEIFETYVNSIFFGNGYYGIYDASMGYYGVPPHELNEYEATMLAGVPNAPSVYAPTTNYTLASQRQMQVIDELTYDQLLSEEQIRKIERQKENDRLIITENEKN